MKKLFAFKTNKFKPTPMELDENSTDFINDGMFARELSTWLKAGLEDKGWVVPFIAVEDWGHWVEVETGHRKKLALCCGQQYSGEHLIFTDPDRPVGRRFVFWTYDLTEDMARLVGDVEAMLTADPDIEITRTDAVA